MKRSSFSTWVYLLLVFASGAALGVFSDRIYTTKTVSAKSGGPPRDPNEYKRKYVEEMRSRLNLDQKQVSELSTILDETRAKMRDLHEKERPAMTAIHQDQLERVRAMLNPAQQVEYSKLLADRAAKEKTEREKRDR